MDSNVEMVLQIKKELKEFHKKIKPIVDYFNRGDAFPEQVTASVLLQNASFGKVDESNVNEQLNKFKKINELLNDMASYFKDDHVINTIKKEFDNIIFSYEMRVMDNDF